MKLNKELYLALKERIFIKPLNNGKQAWFFCPKGLNEELGYEWEDEIDGIVQVVKWNGNWWNLAQHVFSFISDYKDVEQRLLSGRLGQKERSEIEAMFLAYNERLLLGYV